MRVWDLEMGRGIRDTRSFSGPIAKVCIAPTVEHITKLANRRVEPEVRLPRTLDQCSGRYGRRQRRSGDCHPDGTKRGSRRRSTPLDLTTSREQVWDLKRLGICDAAARSTPWKAIVLFASNSREPTPESITTQIQPEHPDKGLVIGRMRNLLGATPFVSTLDACLPRPCLQGRSGPRRRVRRGASRHGAGQKACSNSLMRRRKSNSGRCSRNAEFSLDPFGKYMAMSGLSFPAAAHAPGNPRRRQSGGPTGVVSDLAGADAPAFSTHSKEHPHCALFRHGDKEAIVTLGNDEGIGLREKPVLCDVGDSSPGAIVDTQQVNVCDIERLA